MRARGPYLCLLAFVLAQYVYADPDNAPKYVGIDLNLYECA